MRPTRFDLMLQYAKEFVTEWFDQNPLGQIGVVGMRAGIGERVVDMSGTFACVLAHFYICLREKHLGNPQDIVRVLSDRPKLEPTGEPSLQNAIEMARGSMAYVYHEFFRKAILMKYHRHLPAHSSREIFIIFGSLTSVDPGNIHETLDNCVKDRIRISVIALAAEMKICRDLCDKTGGGYIMPSKLPYGRAMNSLQVALAWP